MKGIAIRTSPHGQGVFVTRRRSKGEEVCKVVGPVIDFAAAVAKGERECDALQISSTSYIDLEDPLRLVNHACRPNCGIRDGNRLIAITDLAVGDELTYDYSTTMDERHWTLVCRCGKDICRGIVDDFRTLPPEVQERYLRARVVMPFIAEQYK